jgi:hypothetical protein
LVFEVVSKKTQSTPRLTPRFKTKKLRSYTMVDAIYHKRLPETTFLCPEAQWPKSPKKYALGK